MSAHAIDRARQRYGVSLSFHDIDEIRRIIAEDPRDVIPLPRDRNIAVRYRGVWMAVVLSPDGGINTVLGENCLSPVVNEINARERHRARLLARRSATA
jgi:hypothetical protein